MTENQMNIELAKTDCDHHLGCLVDGMPVAEVAPTSMTWLGDYEGENEDGERIYFRASQVTETWIYEG